MNPVMRTQVVARLAHALGKSTWHMHWAQSLRHMNLAQALGTGRGGDKASSHAFFLLAPACCTCT
eukprot:1144077-Pelagomonas_calceolata.AAC.3